MLRFRKRKLPRKRASVLSIIEGAEGGLAIFAGILVGLSFDVTERSILIMLALLGIFASAIHASATIYLDQEMDDEIDGVRNHHPFRDYFLPGLKVFAVYIASAGLAALPLVVIPDHTWAVVSTVAVTFGFLFGAGWYRGMTMKDRQPLSSALAACLLGLVVISASAVIGLLTGRISSW